MSNSCRTQTIVNFDAKSRAAVIGESKQASNPRSLGQRVIGSFLDARASGPLELPSPPQHCMMKAGNDCQPGILPGPAGPGSISSVRKSRMFRPVYCTLPLVLVLVGAGCGGKSERQRIKGDEFLQQGQLDQAEASYKQAVAEDSTNVLAQVGLARTLLRRGNAEGALESYGSAIAAQPKNVLPYLEATRIHLDKGDTDSAIGLAAKLTEEDADQGAVLRAFIHRRLGQQDQAIALLEKRLEESPDSVPVRINLATAYMQTKRYSDAEVQLKQMLEMSGGASAPARMMLVDLYRAQGKLDEMIAELETAGTAPEADDNARLALAMGYLETGRAKDAESIALEVLEKHPDSGWANFVFGSCKLANNDADQAKRYLQTAAQLLPGQPAVLRRLEEAEAGGATSATATPRGAVGAAPSGGEADWRQVWSDGRLDTFVEGRGNYAYGKQEGLEQALALAGMLIGKTEVIQEAAARLEANEPMKRVVDEYLALRNATDTAARHDALLAWKETIDTWKEEPGSPLALVRDNMEAFMYASLGLRSQAFTLYARALETWPRNAVALRAVVMMYVSAQMPEHAVASAKRWVELFGNNEESRQILLGLLNQSGLDDEARQFAEATFALNPDDERAAISLASIYLKTGETDGALRVLEGFNAQGTVSDRVKTMRASALLRAGKPSEAVAALDDTRVPDDLVAAAREIRAFAAAETKEWDRCAALLTESGIADLSPALKLLLAAARQLSGAAEAAAALPAPDEVVPSQRGAVAVAAAAMGSPGTTAGPEDAALAQALAARSDLAGQFTYGLACRAAGLSEQSFNALKAVAESLPDQAQATSIVIEVLASARAVRDRGQAARALAQNHRGAVNVLLALARVLNLEKDEAGERETLVEASGIAPERSDVWSRLALVGVAQKENQLAMMAYENLVKLQPDNPSILNNYAYFLIETNGDLSAAAANASKALEKLPGSPAVMHTLGLAQLKLGDLENAKKNLEVAVSMRPGDPTLSLDFGKLLIQQGKVEEGLRFVRAATAFAGQIGVDFPRIAEAREILSKYAAPQQSADSV